MAINNKDVSLKNSVSAMNKTNDKVVVNKLNMSSQESSDNNENKIDGNIKGKSKKGQVLLDFRK